MPRSNGGWTGWNSRPGPTTFSGAIKDFVNPFPEKGEIQKRPSHMERKRHVDWGKAKKRNIEPMAFATGSKAGGRRPRPAKPKKKMVKVEPVVTKTGQFNRGSISGPVSAIITSSLAQIASQGFTQVASALSEEIVNQATIKGKYIVKRVFNPPGLTGRPDRTVPFMSEEKSQPARNMGTVEPKIMHKTKVMTGNPSSKTLLEMGRENGTEKITIFDSKLWQTPSGEGGGGSIMNRSVLSHSCGFNCRNFMTPGTAAYVTYADFVRLALGTAETENVEIGTGITSSYADGKTYASVLETTAEMQFHNQSSYLPLKMTIHIVARRQGSEDNFIKEPSQEIFEMAKFAGEDPMGDNYNPTREGIPGWYVVGRDAVENSGWATGGDFTSFHLLNSGKGLFAAPRFRENYTVIDSKTKTLEPNDFWQFRHEHQFGSGIDLDAIAGSHVLSSASGTSTPLSYFYIIETKGLPCEGVYLQPSVIPSEPFREPRFGTSPGYYYMEIRKTMKYVRPSENARELTPGFSDVGGPATLRIHTRTFTNVETLVLGASFDRKPFHRLPQDIGVTGTSDEAFYIPMEVETVSTNAGAKTKSGGGDEDPNNR